MNYKSVMLYRIGWMALILIVGIWALYTFDLKAAIVILLVVAVASTIAHAIEYHIGRSDFDGHIRLDK